MQLPSALFGLSPQKYSLKIFLIFFLKKPALKKFLIFPQKNFSKFQETELSYIFLKKVFLIFRERSIQNPDIFRTKSILTTLLYSEPEAYSKYCQKSTMERFAKIATVALFKRKLDISASLYFRKWNFLALIIRNFLFFLKKAFLIFQEM